MLIPILILTILIIVIICVIKGNKSSIIKSSEKSLYDRLGGIYNIAKVIDDFSDNIINNPIAGKNSQNPQLRDWHRNQLDRLPGLKFMRTLWVASISGGPFRFIGTVPEKCPFSLEGAHKKLKISPEEFDAVAGELTKSLDKFGVPSKEKGEVLSVFAKHKSDINQGYFMSRGIKTDIKC